MVNYWENFHDAAKDYVTSEKLFQFWFEGYRPLLTERMYKNLRSLLEEYENRTYSNSMWKSYPEYMLFLKDCANTLAISRDEIHRYMIKLIVEGSMTECGFSIFDGKYIKNPPENYREQFYYYTLI